MDINGPDSAFKLDLKRIGLTLLGSGSNEETGVKNDRIMGAENAHFSYGKSIIKCSHPSLISHGGGVPIVDKSGSGCEKE